MRPREAILQISDAMNAAIIGQQDVVERSLIALLADGHVLMEGLPGVAKTRSREKSRPSAYGNFDGAEDLYGAFASPESWNGSALARAFRQRSGASSAAAPVPFLPPLNP